MKAKRLCRLLILLWTTIRWIPLAPQPGQAAEVIGPAAGDIDIVSSHGNLVTDGSFLYWQSDTAINKMPIRGEAVTILDTTPLTRPATGSHLIGPNLIYAVDRIVCHVPADGSAIAPPNLRVVFTSPPASSPAPPGGIHLRGRPQRCHRVAFRQRQRRSQTAAGCGVHHCAPGRISFIVMAGSTGDFEIAATAWGQDDGIVHLKGKDGQGGRSRGVKSSKVRFQERDGVLPLVLARLEGLIVRICRSVSAVLRWGLRRRGWGLPMPLTLSLASPLTGIVIVSTVLP